jgi:hypothetical protein
MFLIECVAWKNVRQVKQEVRELPFRRGPQSPCGEMQTMTPDSALDAFALAVGHRVT